MMFQQLKRWIRNSFGFSKAETNGFLIILLVMLLSILVPFYFKSVSKGPGIDPNDRLLLDSLISQIEATPAEFQKIPEDSLFRFNPNTVEFDELRILGLSNFVSNNIVKYRESGGVFTYKENLTKIYGMNDSIYQTISGFIDLPNTPKITPPIAIEKGLSGQPQTDYRPEPVIFDINSADTVDLKRIRGIGSVLSKRVIKYRNLLGGFYSKDQYGEVYNLDPEVIVRLAMQTTIDSQECCKKLSINSLSLEELMRHPYLTGTQAQAIVAYRKQHGDFGSLDEVKAIHLVDPDTYARIYPYLKL